MLKFNRHIQGLDGLRAIAVIAVLFFHSDFSWARGGFLGVDLFFVLSGFLITGLLVAEAENSSGVRLKSFYWRRAKRLLPAVWLMIGCVAIAASFIASDALTRLKSDALASIVYLTNWELLRAQTSYFESTGRQPLLMHLWSLAIEEQFYLIWPLVIACCFGFIRRTGLAMVAIGMAAASVWWMWTMAQPEGETLGNVSRLYFGTDTHGFPLLIGASLGLVWRPHDISPPSGLGWNILGTAAGTLLLGVMLFFFASMGEENELLYPWGFLAFALTCAALVVFSTHPGMLLGRLLDCPPMRWVGNRSYGIYLWHWPIFMMLRPGIDFRETDPSVMMSLRLLLPIVIAAVSYKYVEMPVRHGAIDRAWKQFRDPSSGFAKGVKATLVSGMAFAFLGASTAILWGAPAKETAASDVSDLFKGMESTEGGVQKPTTSVPVVPSKVVQPPTPVETTMDSTMDVYSGKDIVAVGDSVMLGSRNLLTASLKGLDLHATVGWQAADVLQMLKSLKAKKLLRRVVLLHLGTNGYVYEGQLREILGMLHDENRVVLVNSNVPRRWMSFNNALIDRIAPDFKNTIVVRWNDISDHQPDFFVSDGVHLTDLGQRAFIAEIMRKGHLVSNKMMPSVPAGPAEDVRNAAVTGDMSPTLVLMPQSKAPDRFWTRLAQCETDGQWSNQGSRSGGLSISTREWEDYGGNEYAQEPGEATREQQIEIANRIATQGWNPSPVTQVKPIGYARWRCSIAVRPPPPQKVNGLALTYTRDSVLAQTFHLGQRGLVVRDLQAIIGSHVDGIYNVRDQKRFTAFSKKQQLATSLAEPVSNTGFRGTEGHGPNQGDITGK